MLSVVDPALAEIAGKVERGERLDRAEGIRLFNADLFTLGALANVVRERKHGDNAYYTHTLHLNYSNACVLSCGLCAFYRPLDHGEAYTFSVEQMRERAAAAGRLGVREFHITGGLNPKLPMEYYEEMFRMLKETVPGCTVKAFTSVEIDFFSKLFRLSVDEVFQRFKAAGMDCMPGGGAEILAARVRKIICPEKISGERWLEVQKRAHLNGIPTNATMLYGHFETAAERIDHMIAIRGLQEETGGVQAFVPLAYHAEGTEFPDLPPTTGCEDLKVYAISRIMLDNVPHIKLLWTYVGTKMIQVALDFGVDDVGSTNLEERIVKAAGADHFDAPSVNELTEMITKAGRVPQLINSLYQEGGVAAPTAA
ncbi:MAG: aminofutalosine synthase MqnE [Candidatus Omnitrophica bacterium CG11_big_fil_rev_8_21_14_0_20_64_10]|nr:MAG: aminofutalosine synthase MqnE [Candidatus Omnitrophica bacterium CG11_big_fil_rev_8_21_14_0_20_64_10]